MKKITGFKLLFAAFVFIVFAVACKKHTDDPPSPPTPPKWTRVKSKNVGQPTNTWYAYDDSGRLLTESFGYDTLWHHYTDNEITVTNNYGGNYTVIETYKTVNGLAYEFWSKATMADRFATFKYNASKMRTSWTDTIISGGINSKTVYFRSGQNTDSIKRYGIGNQVVLTHRFEYYTDKKNTIGNEGFGKLYYGVDDANPLKRVTIVYEWDKSTSHTDYTYQYDAEGRIIKLTGVRDGDAASTFSYTYTYY